jgi:DNA-binding NarL/FixJ family response regulator
MSSRGRVPVADDHKLIAELCQRLLETEFDVVGVVADGRALVRAAEQFKPDVIVLDIAMPVLNGLDAGRQIKQVLPAVKLVYLTMNTDAEVADAAFRCGASGYLRKTCAATDLVNTVRDVLKGKSRAPKFVMRDARGFVRRQTKKLDNEDARLSTRQREVLQLLAEGKIMKEIGSLLHMKFRTVVFHKYRMREVLGVKSDAELVKYAIRNNIVPS